MLVANSFDLWQKDTFFSAAEEVQQSADIMESAYRTWIKARKEGLIPQDLDELSRELQMALGTAKWQLEEFERAVRLSYRNKGDDVTITRHRQFVTAIEDQISPVENMLKESLNVEGKHPFCWVNLDQEECDDLALFLSGTSDESDKSSTIKDSYSEDVVMSIEDIGIELQENKVLETGDEVSHQADRITSNRRARSSPGGTLLEIVVDNDDREKNGVIEEATPKEKGFRPFFWRCRSENCAGTRGVLSHTQMKMISWINQLRGGHRSQRQVHVPPMSPVNSIRFVLALMLTLFLVVPFLLYSS